MSLLVLVTLCLSIVLSSSVAALDSAAVPHDGFNPVTPMTVDAASLSFVSSLLAPPSSDITPGKLNFLNLSRPEGERFLYLYVPSNYTAAVSFPFTFYFHGYTANWMQGVSLNQTIEAEAAGYIIAFPQGTLSARGGLAWNAGVCCVYNTSSVVDDVQFTREALQLIRKTVNIDSQRVYAMGWSNGGYMTERLACETPELWAGICADASAVGILPGGREGLRSCDRSFASSRLNYIHFHGTADPAVSWTGSFNANGTSLVPAALDDLARWVTRLDCAPRLHQTYNDGTFSNLAWPECRDGREVEFMTIRNGVHAWWTQQQGGFETTRYVLQFFTRTYNKQKAIAVGRQS